MHFEIQDEDGKTVGWAIEEGNAKLMSAAPLLVETSVTLLDALGVFMQAPSEDSDTKLYEAIKAMGVALRQAMGHEPGLAKHERN